MARPSAVQVGPTYTMPRGPRGRIVCARACLQTSVGPVVAPADAHTAPSSRRRSPPPSQDLFPSPTPPHSCEGRAAGGPNPPPPGAVLLQPPPPPCRASRMVTEPQGGAPYLDLEEWAVVGIPGCGPLRLRDCWGDAGLRLVCFALPPAPGPAEVGVSVPCMRGGGPSGSRRSASVGHGMGRVGILGVPLGVCRCQVVIVVISPTESEVFD